MAPGSTTQPMFGSLPQRGCQRKSYHRSWDNLRRSSAWRETDSGPRQRCLFRTQLGARQCHAELNVEFTNGHAKFPRNSRQRASVKMGSSPEDTHATSGTNLMVTSPKGLSIDFHHISCGHYPNGAVKRFPRCESLQRHADCDTFMGPPWGTHATTGSNLLVTSPTGAVNIARPNSPGHDFPKGGWQ